MPTIPFQGFNNSNSFLDYQKLDQEFQEQKALRAQQMQTAGTQNQLQQFQLQQAKTNGALNLLGSVNDEASYQAAKQQAAQRFGMDTSTLPQNYDPNWVKNAQAQLLDAKDKVSLGMEQAKLNETSRHNQAEEYNQSGGWGTPPPSVAPTPTTIAAPPANTPSSIPPTTGTTPPTTGTAPVNNPGNMRPPGATTGFQQFATPEAGMDAMVKDLTLKATGKSDAMNGQRATLRNIISTWAPKGDGKNDPTAYTNFVAQKTGLDPDTLVNPMDIPTKIAPAMAQFEGSKYTQPATAKPAVDLNSLQGDEFLTELKRQQPNAPIAQIKAIANGDQPYPTPYALAKNPGMQKILNAVYQYDPGANANRFADVNKFNVGPQGNQVRSFSVGISHLNTLSNLSDALENRDVKAINAAGNTVQSQLGVAAPTNFDAAKQIVGAELVKAVTGAAGALGDREGLEKTLSTASSPAQLKGVIATYQNLMKGQLGGLQQQYETATGRKDFMSRLTPEALAAFQPSDSPTASSNPPSPPKHGDTVTSQTGTYLFNGGDPADKTNWKKVK